MQKRLAHLQDVHHGDGKTAVWRYYAVAIDDVEFCTDGFGKCALVAALR